MKGCAPLLLLLLLLLRDEMTMTVLSRVKLLQDFAAIFWRQMSQFVTVCAVAILGQ